MLLLLLDTIVYYYNVMLTLRREAGVKLTPDPINRLILKNGFNLCKPNFMTFNIFLLALICDGKNERSRSAYLL